jgi:hypothetical protein
MWCGFLKIVTEEFIAVHWTIFISEDTPHEHTCNFNTLHFCRYLLGSEVYLID